MDHLLKMVKHIQDIQKNGIPNGKGKVYYKNRVLYEGEFVEGLYEGNGKMEYENGNYYIGRWKNGKRNGNGKLYDKNGNLIYDGDWNNDKFEGKGTLNIEKCQQYYIGEFKNELMNGKGCLFWKNGDLVYDGDWVNAKMEGYGKGYGDNGDYFIGKWKDGLQDEGTLYDKNGRIIFKGKINAGEMIEMIKLLFANDS